MDEALRLLKDADEILMAEGIDYCLMFGTLNDPDIGLVRDNKAKIVHSKAVLLKGLPGNLGHTLNRPLKRAEFCQTI